MTPTPAMHARPPDTTENRGDVERRPPHPDSRSPSRGPPATTAMLHRVEPAAEPVGHLDLQDRVAEHGRHHVGRAGQGEHHDRQPELVDQPEQR